MIIALALVLLGITVMASATVVSIRLIARGHIGPGIGVLLGCALLVALMTDAMPGVVQ